MIYICYWGTSLATAKLVEKLGGIVVGMTLLLNFPI